MCVCVCVCWPAGASTAAGEEEDKEDKEEFFFKEVTQELLLLLHWIIYLMADLLHIAHVVEASQLLAVAGTGRLLAIAESF